MKPLRDRIIIERDELPEHSEGGIFLLPKDPFSPDEQRLHTGTITAVGDDITSVCVGERVAVTNWEDMHINGSGLMVIHEADILGILED